jgi:hypothetical protein
MSLLLINSQQKGCFMKNLFKRLKLNPSQKTAYHIKFCKQISLFRFALSNKYRIFAIVVLKSTHCFLTEALHLIIYRDKNNLNINHLTSL